MLKDEAIKQLKHFKSFHNGSYGVPINMAIEALEREPVLDKIRAEILEKCFDVPYENQAFDYGLKIVKWSDVREILDKYKAESEDKG